MKREKESSFKENLVLWITGFIVLGLVLVFIIRDKNRDVPLEEYEYIKNIKVQLEDIKNLLAECNKQPIACKKKSTNLVLKNYSLNMDNEEKINKILNFINEITLSDNKITIFEVKELNNLIFDGINADELREKELEKIRAYLIHQKN